MTYTKEEAQRQFQSWSRSYDRSILQWIYFGPSHRLILDHLAPVGSRGTLRLLDIGCGTGRFAQRVLQHSSNGDADRLQVQFCGMDFCRPMLDHARARHLPKAQFSWVQGESQQLPFEDNSFDAITCVHSFHHYPDQARAVKEMARVLAPGGQAIILDGYRDRPWGWLLYDVIVVSVEGKVHHASAERFRDLFAAAGFENVCQHSRTGMTPMLLTKGTVPLPQPVPAERPARELVHAPA